MDMLWKVALLNQLVSCIHSHRWDVSILPLVFNFGKISIANSQMIDASHFFLKYIWKSHRLRAKTLVTIQIEDIWRNGFGFFFLFFKGLVTWKSEFLLVLLKQHNEWVFVSDSYVGLNIQNMLIGFFALYVCTAIYRGLWDSDLLRY